MKQFLLLFFFILISNYSFAQITNENEFVGTLQLPGKEIITFKINFKQAPDGKIDGTSVSDIYGNDRTKSIIKGNYNSGTKKISFREISNIATKSNSDAKDFCYINVNNAKVKTAGDKTIIQGSFTGKYSSGEKCVDGDIYLIGTAYLESLSKQFLSPQYIKNPDSLKLAQQKVNTLKELTEKTIIKNKEELAINWNSNEIIIEVWDGEQEDNDEIGLFINDKKILDRFILKNNKKTLILPFTESISTIKITGISEGNSPPCTANILLRDGTQNFPIVSVLKKGETTLIKLIKN